MEELLARRLSYFGELISCGQQLWLWEYSPSLSPVQTTCPWSEAFGAYFSLSICRGQLLTYIEEGGKAPLILSDEVGFSWIAAFEQAQNILTRVYLIGPCFTSDVSSRQLERQLANKGAFGDVARMFTQQIRALPILPVTTWFQLGLMLHFTVTGEKLTTSDYAYPPKSARSDVGSEELQPEAGSATWLAEQDAMRMIEEGRLDYKAAMGQLSMSASFASPGEIISPDRKLKNSVLSFVTLCTRAAVRGGLDAETAYHMGNTYIDGVESAQTLSELLRINATMYDDFVMRVHKIKTSSGISTVVQGCCNYIEFHLSEPLTLKSVARGTGYAELYLAQKFKKEMGLPVSKYIQQQRVEKAKRLLKSTSKSILEISEELGFCNSSYFSKVFREVAGTAPAEWRESKT